MVDVLTHTDHNERQREDPQTVLRCACCSCGGALPSMLRPDHNQLARLLSGGILMEPLCNFCWAWTKRVAYDARMRMVLGKVD